MSGFTMWRDNDNAAQQGANLARTWGEIQSAQKQTAMQLANEARDRAYKIRANSRRGEDGRPIDEQYATMEENLAHRLENPYLSEGKNGEYLYNAGVNQPSISPEAKAVHDVGQSIYQAQKNITPEDIQNYQRRNYLLKNIPSSESDAYIADLALKDILPAKKKFKIGPPLPLTDVPNFYIDSEPSTYFADKYAQGKSEINKIEKQGGYTPTKEMAIMNVMHDNAIKDIENENAKLIGIATNSDISPQNRIDAQVQLQKNRERIKSLGASRSNSMNMLYAGATSPELTQYTQGSWTQGEQMHKKTNEENVIPGTFNLSGFKEASNNLIDSVGQREPVRNYVEAPITQRYISANRLPNTLDAVPVSGNYNVSDINNYIQKTGIPENISNQFWDWYQKSNWNNNDIQKALDYFGINYPNNNQR